MVDTKVIKKLRDRMAKLAADAYHGDPEVYCPVCHKGRGREGRGVCKDKTQHGAPGPHEVRP